MCIGLKFWMGRKYVLAVVLTLSCWGGCGAALVEPHQQLWPGQISSRNSAGRSYSTGWWLWSLHSTGTWLPRGRTHNICLCKLKFQFSSMLLYEKKSGIGISGYFPNWLNWNGTWPWYTIVLTQYITYGNINILPHQHPQHTHTCEHMPYAHQWHGWTHTHTHINSWIPCRVVSTDLWWQLNTTLFPPSISLSMLPSLPSIPTSLSEAFKPRVL